MNNNLKNENKKSTIIVRLLGGLGNQMFQYAIGRQLAILHKRDLKLDVSAYSLENQTNRWVSRNFGLGVFNIRQVIAKPEEIQSFTKYTKQSFFSRVLRRVNSIGDYYKRAYIFEPPGRNFIFDSHILSSPLKHTVYLDGFWQTEKYFKNIEGVIRKDFTFLVEPDDINYQMLNKIENEQSVCIHIRHGDNATKLAAVHGVLPISYYKSAVDLLVQRIKNPVFYIFSDDPIWAKNNLKLNFPMNFVTHNGDEKNYEDLRLMTACKHHIIGNSTFSWWGAWLGKKVNQLVFAPSKYHINSNSSTYDLYPQEWEIIRVN